MPLFPAPHNDNSYFTDDYSLTITGGVLGVIIDARGRPIALPRPADQRQELVKQWTWKMGGV